MSNKKFLQSIAALLIIVFHLWIPITNGPIETFIIKTGYIGVDIFFFVSAYSLADKDIKYKSLLKNRFFSIYMKFVIFLLAAAVFNSMSILRVVKSAVLIELFEKGGGAFLWFVPAIVLFYLIYPLFIRWNCKYKVPIVLVAWLLLSIAIERLTGYNRIFIFTNRIPVMLVGYFVKKKPLPRWFTLPCIPVGLVLLYLFGYKNRLNVPVNEMFYVVAIVFVIGLVGLSTLVKPSKIWDALSMGSLELYGLQMVFGPKLVMWLYKIIQNKLVANLLVLAIMFGASALFSQMYKIAILNNIKRFGRNDS